MQLRPYQQRAISAVTSGFESFDRQLAVAATGAGKTVIFSHLAANTPGRTLILAHRQELVWQAVQKLKDATGIYASVEQGSSRGIPGHGVIVGSVQSIRRRMEKYAPDAFDLVICDEAHHAMSDEWQKVLRHFSSAKILGVTATPDRADKKSLGGFFQNVAFEIGLLELIGEGYLCPIRALRLNVECDARRLRTKAKDVSADDAAEAISPVIDDLARAVAGEIWDKKALVFLPRCDVSERFAASLRKRGIDAGHISGDSADRVSILDMFADRGAGSALCNAMLLTEGYDQPDVDCVVILRMTKSRPLYCQMVGRGTRLSPGKDFCTVIDPLWITGELNLCKPADLVAQTPIHRDALQKRLDEGMTLSEAESVAKTDVEALLAEQLREAEKNRKAPKGMIDPLAWAIGIHDSNLTEYEPTMPWEEEPPTAEQLAELERHGLWTERLTRGFAVKLLERVAEREAMNLATPKQLAKLRQFKHPNAETLTKAQAGYFLSTKF